MNNVTIVGLGAIGTVYATALFDAGIPVRIATDESRKIRYTNAGVTLNSKRYDFNYFTPTTGDSIADLIIIATKSSGLTEALELIRPIIGANTQILPLLNGISSEEICATYYGWDRVLYGYFIGHTATRVGNNIHQDGSYRTYFGERDNSTISDRVLRVQAIFEKAGIPYKTPTDMIASSWQKFIINIGMNQATAVLRCTYGHLQTNANAKNFMVALMNEAAAVAKAVGVNGADSMVEKAVSLLGGLHPDDGSSMYQDVIGGRKTEVDIFADTICALAQKHGINTPYNFHASVILKAL